MEQEPIKIDELQLWLLEPELRQASPEERVVLTVVLQAISEQDPLNVVIPTPTAGTVLPTLLQKRVAVEARRFCESPEYSRLCRLIHFDARRRSRSDLAKLALELIGHLRGTAESQSLRAIERRCWQIETRQQLHRSAPPELAEIRCGLPPLPRQTRKRLPKVGRRVDYSGAVIGYLKILGRIAGSLKWECLCTACGKNATATSDYLRRSRQASCPDCAELRRSLNKSLAADEPTEIAIPKLTDEPLDAMYGAEDF